VGKMHTRCGGKTEEGKRETGEENEKETVRIIGGTNEG
jgi:hypothetical protein